MGDSLIPIVRPEMRRLVLSNKGVVKRHLSRAQSLFNHHNIDKKIKRLNENWDSSDQNQRGRELNKICEEFTSLLLSSEKKYRKLLV